MNVFDHPFLSGLLGDGEISGLLSAEADLAAMLEFEAALAEAQARAGLVAAASAEKIARAASEISADLPALNAATARDGVVVPGLLAQIRSSLDEKAGKELHFGATSQDVIDTSFAMRAVAALDILDSRLEAVIGQLEDINRRDGQKTVMAHTRMQSALPVKVSRKIASWRAPLVRHRERLANVRAGIGIVHLGGPVGSPDKLGDKGEAVMARMAIRLGLGVCSQARHNERDAEAELANWLSLVTGSLGKIGADIALFAQQEMDEIEISRGGGSSAMPHKVNPVGAEILVSFARFNAALLAAMHGALVHENERSGSAWTLEWMVLPQMLLATGAALRTAAELLQSIAFVESGD